MGADFLGDYKTGVNEPFEATKVVFGYGSDLEMRQYQSSESRASTAGILESHF